MCLFVCPSVFVCFVGIVGLIVVYPCLSLCDPRNARCPM